LGEITLTKGEENITLETLTEKIEAASPYKSVKEMMLQRRADKSRDIKDLYLAIVRTEQGNIRKAGDRRKQILKGIQSGADPVDMLLLATETIALMTGDITYYKQAEKDIRREYMNEQEPSSR